MRQLKKDLINTIKLVNDFISANEWNIAFAKNIHEEPTETHYQRTMKMTNFQSNLKKQKQKPKQH